MKKLIIIALILAAGLTAYPQSSRSSREAKSSKGRSSQVASKSSSRSGSSQVKKSSNSQSRSKATTSRSSNSSRSAAYKSSGSSSRSGGQKAVQSRSSSNSGRSAAVKSGNSSSRSSGNVRSGNSSSRSSSAVRSGGSSSKSSGAVRSGNSSSRNSSAVKAGNSNSRSSAAVRSSRSSSGSSANRVGTSSGNRSGQSAARSSSSQRTSRSAVKSNDNKVIQSGSSRSAVPGKIANSERGRSQSAAVKTRDNNNNNNDGRRVASNSFDRSNRNGSKTYVSTDGKKYRHQNDEVFTRTRYRTDYRDVNALRRSNDFVRVHNHYHNWYSHRHVRRVVVHNHFYRPVHIDIRRVRYPYRVPVHFDLCWTPHLHHTFMYYYPLHNNWNNHRYGEYIETASSYEAMNYVGTVKRVYGKVEEVYYSPEDRTYTLYFGAPYPYHDFSVVVPRDVAKRFSWSPSWYFEDEHVWVVGLIETWEGKPEIVLHESQQIRRY